MQDMEQIYEQYFETVNKLLLFLNIYNYFSELIKQ